MNNKTLTPITTGLRPRMTDPIGWLRSEVDRLFDDYGDTGRRMFKWSAGAAAWPPLDLQEIDKGYTVSVDVAGYDRDQIDLSVEDGCLILKGNRNEQSERSEDGMIVNERHQGRFERRIAMPGRFDPAGIQAKLDHGVLQIVIPKIADPAARKVEIDVTG
jgi:HSP20 family protein